MLIFLNYQKKGRLDFNSEGLLLITNDGELARLLELPESKLERVKIYFLSLTKEGEVELHRFQQFFYF